LSRLARAQAGTASAPAPEKPKKPKPNPESVAVERPELLLRAKAMLRPAAKPNLSKVMQVEAISQEEWADITDPLALIRRVEEVLEGSMGVPRPRPHQPPRKKIGFLKTHKTGSTTVGSIVYRYAARNGLKHYQEDGHIMHFNKPERFGQPGEWDAIYNHWTGTGYWTSNALDNSNAFSLLQWYRRMLGAESELVTIFRNPDSHYLSWYTYYEQPQRPEVPFDEWLKQGHNNPQASTFGFQLQSNRRQLLKRFLHEGLESMDLIMVMERMSESLVVLRHRMNWDLRDVVSLKMYSSKDGAVRFDDKVVQPTPKLSSLSDARQNRIKELTSIDLEVYKRAEVMLSQQVEQLKEYGVDVEGEVAALEHMNKGLDLTCKSVRAEMMRWFRIFRRGLRNLIAQWRRSGEGGQFPLPTAFDMEPWWGKYRPSADDDSEDRDDETYGPKAADLFHLFKTQVVYRNVPDWRDWERMGVTCWWYSLSDTCYELLARDSKPRGFSPFVPPGGIHDPPYEISAMEPMDQARKELLKKKRWNWFELYDFNLCECKGVARRRAPCFVGEI